MDGRPPEGVLQETGKINNLDALGDLIEWICRDWDVSKKEATKWIQSYMEFLEHMEKGDIILKSMDGNLPVNAWLGTFFYPGRSTIIVAPNGQGKTYFASWIMKKAMIVHPNWMFVTNVPYYFFEEKYEFLRPKNVMQVRSLSEVFEIVAQDILEGKQTAMILDETESFSTSHNWRDSSWIAFLNISRHLLIRGPLLIYHATNLIPFELRTGQIGNQIMPLMVHEGKRYVASFSTKPHRLVIDSSDVILPYSHLGWGGFKTDVDVVKLEQEIVQIDIRKAAKLIQQHLDKFLLREKSEKLPDPDLSEKRRAAVMNRWNKAKGVKS